MCRINNEFWGINIYNEDCDLLRTHELNNTSATGITCYGLEGHDRVITAHEEGQGLHEYDMDGKFRL